MNIAPTETETEDATEMGMVFREDGEGGRTLAFKEIRITALGYADLKAARLHQAVTVPFEVRNALVVSTDIERIDDDTRVSIKTILQSPFSARAIGLVRGGWVPAGFAVVDPSAVILIDRNILTDIEGRFACGVLTGVQEDFLDFFAHYPVRLNPLLCVMEGNLRRRLSREELETEFVRICGKLQRALPNAKVVASDYSVTAIEGLIEDTRLSTEAYQEFLLEVADDLASPIGRKRQGAVWAKVVDAASRHRIRFNSIVLLAVLSVVANPDASSPARGILKFKRGYDVGNAYGALADLRALEVLCALLALFPQTPAQFCTADRSLALFWAGLQASGFTYTGYSYRFDLKPVDDLLPGETMTWWLELVGSG